MGILLLSLKNDFGLRTDSTVCAGMEQVLGGYEEAG